MCRASKTVIVFLFAALCAFLVSGITAPSRAQNWEPVPLITKESRDAGNVGGEGAQWARAMAVSGGGELLLYGTDVGGLFRSRDGGNLWEPCNVGYTPRGTSGLAIDPHNPRRCLSVGANSIPGNWNGIYLSVDGAASWKQVFPANIAGSQDSREQIAFDPATYDANAGYTRVVYWSRIGAEDKPPWGKPEIHPALYKSEDGGQTWRELPGTSAFGGSIIKVQTLGLDSSIVRESVHNHILFAANAQGFFRSLDGGKTFAHTFHQPCDGLDVSAQGPGPDWPSVVYICGKGSVWRSDDQGKTFQRLPGKGLPTTGVLLNIHANPFASGNLVLWANLGGYNWPRFYSHDGGETWQQAKIDNTNAFLPSNARQGLFVWHPTQYSVAWSVGGDWPTKSEDGGQTWKWSGNGYNVVLVGGMFEFNAQNPDLLFVGSQDYNGASTNDGGKTWTYQNPSGNGWGGFTYGGYAASPLVMFVGNAASWGDPRILTVTRNGGKTWTSTGLKYAGPDVANGDPTDPNVLFASNLRSADGGKTWQPMPACQAVYTYSPTNSTGARELYGKNKTTLVRSRDHGVTWTPVADIPGGLEDIACDPIRKRWYVASEGRLKQIENGKVTTVDTPPDQYGSHRVTTVAVDPVQPNIIYVGSHKDLYSASNSVLRSTDAGVHWTILTCATPLDGKTRDGGREAFCIRVHPKTRYAYVATSCYGLWKIAPP